MKILFSNTVLLTTAGVPFDMGDVAVSLQSQCLTDTFQVRLFGLLTMYPESTAFLNGSFCKSHFTASMIFAIKTHQARLSAEEATPTLTSFAELSLENTVSPSASCPWFGKLQNMLSLNAVYVEAEDASCCNDLVFQLGNDGFMGQTVASRQWSIKVSRKKR